MKKEVEELIDIIKNEFGVDIKKKTRKQAYIDGRFVLAKILTDRGYGISDLGRITGKHHSSIIHHRNSANNLIDTNPAFAEKYMACRDKFMSGKNDLNEIPEKERLLNQIDALILDRNTLLEKVQKHKRLNNIIEFIDSRTPRGKESFVLRKINLMFNGLTDYGQELEW